MPIPDSDAVIAGVEKLNEFKSMAVIDSLTGGRLEMYDTYYLYPHCLIMEKQRLDTERYNFNIKLNRIKNKSL